MYRRCGGLFVVLCLVGFLPWAKAGTPEVTQQAGHFAPVLVEITLKDGKIHKGMLTMAFCGLGYTHRYVGGGAGQQEISIWLDTINRIDTITKDDARFVLKDGKEVIVKHYRPGPSLTIVQESDLRQEFSLPQVKQVRFLKVAPKDKGGKAMFDHWKFSPYTGEKLP